MVLRLRLVTFVVSLFLISVGNPLCDKSNNTPAGVLAVRAFSFSHFQAHVFSNQSPGISRIESYFYPSVCCRCCQLRHSPCGLFEKVRVQLPHLATSREAQVHVERVGHERESIRADQVFAGCFIWLNI